MLGDILVNGFLVVSGVFCLVVLMIIWLWRRKSEVDRRAFDEVLGSDKVKTFYRPEDYAEASEKKDIQKTREK